jgi:hypothetical protein
MLSHEPSIALRGFRPSGNHIGKVSLIKAPRLSELRKVIPLDQIVIWVNKFEFFSFSSTSSALSRAISHIYELRSKKQVFRSDAKRIVAFVADVKRFIKISVGQLIGHPMGHRPSSFATNNKYSIGWAFGSGPYPATISLFDFLPKSNFQRLPFRHGNIVNHYSSMVKE